jgi:putative flippase GtrA
VRKLFKHWILETTDNASVQLLRSLIVGGIATVADMGILALIYELAHASEFIATAIGFALGLVINYILSHYWVFPSSGFKQSSEFLVFAVIGIIGLFLTELIVKFFIGPMADHSVLPFLNAEAYIYPGKVVSVVVVFFWNFLLRKFVIYRKRS